MGVSDSPIYKQTANTSKHIWNVVCSILFCIYIVNILSSILSMGIELKMNYAAEQVCPQSTYANAAEHVRGTTRKNIESA